MAFNSRIEIEGKKEDLQAYYNALAPEQDFGKERASYKLKQERDKLAIEISAEDATAFRALLNSLAGAIAVVEKSLKN
jgi:tRNA threonylcarbamoyladenosine modification (KEOPS) complex  Pcc1 subunit